MLNFFVVVLFFKVLPLLPAIIFSATLAEKWDDSAPLLFSQTHLGIYFSEEEGESTKN